jgi:hypothetical protein
MKDIVGKIKSDNRLLYLLFGFFGIILFFIFLLVYKPVGFYKKGRNLQALDPDKLPEDQRWSRERTIREYKAERNRRKMMRQDIYA